MAKYDYMVTFDLKKGADYDALQKKNPRFIRCMVSRSRECRHLPANTFVAADFGSASKVRKAIGKVYGKKLGPCVVIRLSPDRHVRGKPCTKCTAMIPVLKL